MWKNNKASMVSISSDYLTELQISQSNLRSELRSANVHIEQLKERIQYLESCYESDIISEALE